MKGIRHMARRTDPLTALGIALTFAVPPGAPAQNGGIATAYIQNGRIWTCAYETSAGPHHDNAIGGAPDWVIVEQRDVNGRKLVTYRLLTMGFRDARTPLRWHLAYDALWVAGQKAHSRRTPPGLRVPLDKLESFDRDLKSFIGSHASRGNPQNDAAEKVAARPKSIGSGALRGKDDADPAIRYLWPMFPWTYLDGYAADLTFDVLPTSPDSCRVLYRIGPEIKVYESNGLEEFKEVNHFEVDFKEWFRVFGSRDAVILVTHSGKVYLAKRGGAKILLQALWNDPIRPVVAAVVDVASDTTYLLAQAVPRAQSKYIRLDKDGRLTEKFIDPAKLKPFRGDKPLEACVPFAQYLFAEGLLTEKRP